MGAGEYDDIDDFEPFTADEAVKLGVVLLEDISGDKVPVGAETPEEKTPALKGTSA